MPFPTLSYNPQLLVCLERTVTHERLDRYLRATGDDIPRAVYLYEANVALCEALYGLLHGLEVAVRNAIHHELTTSYGRPDWYELVRLSPHWHGELARAKRKIQQVTPDQPLAGKAVAELTFGFWVELLSRSHHNTLWMGMKLRRAFPHTSLDRQSIHTRLKSIQQLRNRISHHERVLTTRKLFYFGSGFLTLNELLEPVEWICGATSIWLRNRFRYATAAWVLAKTATTGARL